SYQQAVAANRDIVANLDEIVDLGPFANHGVLDGSAIDGAVGADFHAVLDDDPTDLRDLAGTLGARDKPESVLSDRTARMHDHAIADKSMGYRSIGTDCTIAADTNAGPDDGARTNERTGANFGAGSNHSAGIDRYIVLHARRAIDERTRCCAGYLEQRGWPQRI